VELLEGQEEAIHTQKWERIVAQSTPTLYLDVDPKIEHKYGRQTYKSLSKY
jgi:hypothetical protein